LPPRGVSTREADGVGGSTTAAPTGGCPPQRIGDRRFTPGGLVNERPSECGGARPVVEFATGRWPSHNRGIATTASPTSSEYDG